jgi:small subunit ribosomal protein S1
VDSLKPYGAFIDLGNGLSGLLHISQISQQRIKHPGAVLKEGQKVKVKIISTDGGKISLSMKALEDVAAEVIEEEVFELPEAEAATTSLGSLFKNIKL